MQAGGVDAGRGRGRRWRGQGRQEETPSNSRLGAREGVAVNRVRRGGTDDQKKNPTRSRLKRGGGWGHETKRVAGINKVSCKFHVTLFGCRVGGDVGQLGNRCCRMTVAEQRRFPRECSCERKGRFVLELQVTYQT